MQSMKRAAESEALAVNVLTSMNGQQKSLDNAVPAGVSVVASAEDKRAENILRIEQQVRSLT
jgi:GTP:adenosylcobinamide-phosphate guanylyltransferase